MSLQYIREFLMQNKYRVIQLLSDSPVEVYVALALEDVFCPLKIDYAFKIVLYCIV